MHTLSLQLAASLQPVLSPRLQRAVRLLQMSSQDFAQVVRAALDSNPFLEGEAAEGPGDEEGDAPSAAWEAASPSRPRPDAPEAGFDTLAAGTTLAEHLQAQLRLLRLPAREADLAAACAAALDDDGWLRMPLAELGRASGLRPLPDAAELRLALRRVQALEPAGVGARDLVECLRLQLPQVPAPLQPLAARILRECLPCLAARDRQAVARRLGVEPALAEAACAAIRRLDPRPGWRVAAPAAEYVLPDVLVRRVRGQWTAVLNEAVVPRVRLNDRYAELFRRHRGSEHAALGEHLQEARWTVRNVEQRCATILAVAQAILRRQQRWLAYGAMGMKPLALREIAQEVGVHESTVSRVTCNKYMATPHGVVELRTFFSRGLTTAGGAACAPAAVRGLLQELLAAEDPRQPLSDPQLAQALAQQGLRVARRTVTKYRQQLRIAPVERRRAATS